MGGGGIVSKRMIGHQLHNVQYKGGRTYLPLLPPRPTSITPNYIEITSGSCEIYWKELQMTP